METTVGATVDISMVTNVLLPFIVDFGDGSEHLTQNTSATTASNTYTLEGDYYITG